MSALTLSQSVTALGPNIPASFLASGGTAPYTYSVRPNGAGGVINASSGAYTAPAQAASSGQSLFDVVQVVDSSSPAQIATAKILVGSPLLLFCDILQTALGLQPGRVYLWDQKLMQPTDSGLYIAVSVASCKPFGSVLELDGSGSGLNSNQYIAVMATLDLDILSRGPAARDQKELVLLALASSYSQSQQEINSFSIGRLPASARFINLSQVDGAAIPYRFRISVNMQYAVSLSTAIPYYSSFQAPSLTTNA